jgi:HAD superfamily hydrolase (TIGR01549 family)
VIRAVTFDCWGTLITDSDLDRPFDVRVTALLEAADGRLDRDGAEALLRRAWDEHHRSWVTGVQYGAPGMARFCAAELQASDDLLCDRLQEAFEEAGRHGTLEALPGAVEALATLREAGIRTALVCDTGLTPGRVVRDFLSDAGVLPYLEFCAFSNEVGEPKPNAKIFDAALDAIGTQPAEAAHVGDLLRTDVHGARAIGMKTVRITAVNDDVATRFSWEPSASFGTPASQHSDALDVDDADEVVTSHAELIGALRRLGAPL